jgi:hypothetical protein
MKEKKQSATWIIALSHFASGAFAAPFLSVFFLMLTVLLVSSIGMPELEDVGFWGDLVSGIFLLIIPMLSAWLCAKRSANYINNTYIIKNSKNIITIALIYMLAIEFPLLLFSSMLGPVAPTPGYFLSMFVEFIIMSYIFYVVSKKYIKNTEEVIAPSVSVQ